MLVESGAGQGAVAFGELEGGFGSVFSDDEGILGQQGAVGVTAEESQGLGVRLFFKVRRVEEDDVDAGGRFGEPLEQRHDASVFKGIAAGDFQVLHVGSKGLQGWATVFGEEDVGRSPADGFEPDGSRSSEEIDKLRPVDAGRNNVE